MNLIEMFKCAQNNNFDPLIFNSKKFGINLHYVLHHSNELQECL